MGAEHPLDSFFKPKTVAVVGAKETPNSIGRTLMMNLLTGGFTGRIIPINPSHATVCGLPCFSSVVEIEEPIDLAVIAVPASHVFEVVHTCRQAKIPAAIVISAGFKELGPEGLKLEEMVAKEAKEGGIRLIGPNCLGIMNPHIGLNASFARGIARKGSLAFVSQSGAMCTAVLDWSFQNEIGFSSFVSIGSMADVAWPDLIEYLGHDEHTHSILMYMETVGDPGRFLDAARSVALDKPIIVIKPGRSKEAAKAAASHTGALVGSDDVFDIACERGGILRVGSIADLFNIAKCLACQPRTRGPRLAIVTNAGGPAVLATDAAIANGSLMADLSRTTINTLNHFLPPAWTHGNPVDMLGDATPACYEQTVSEVMKDSNVDAVLAILSPQDMTDPTNTAKLLKPFASNLHKPFMTCWMGGAFVREGRQILTQAGIPCFPFPDEAAKSFSLMWKHSQLVDRWARPPRERYFPSKQEREKRIEQSRTLIDAVLKEGRTLLTERESKQLLSYYRIPVIETFSARTAFEAADRADAIGYPVVIKVESHTITHKTDAGGVMLNLQNREAVISAFSAIQTRMKELQQPFIGASVEKMVGTTGIELIIGSSIDPQFGPVLLFGAGGILVEFFNDRAIELPPLNAQLARNMIERTKISRALSAPHSGETIPLQPVEEILINLGELVQELPMVCECDMNPILATSRGVLCLDARVVVSQIQLPKPACRPYPWEYVFEHDDIVIRPIRPEDVNLIFTFLDLMPKETFNTPLFEGKVIIEQLYRMCFAPFNCQIVMVATKTHSPHKLEGIAAVLKTSPHEGTLFIATTSCSEELYADTVAVARAEGIKTLP